VVREQVLCDRYPFAQVAYAVLPIGEHPTMATRTGSASAANPAVVISALLDSTIVELTIEPR
jgi:hypothetical protein